MTKVLSRIQFNIYRNVETIRSWDEATKNTAFYCFAGAFLITCALTGWHVAGLQ